jgi:phage-related baseplate assembly protein
MTNRFAAPELLALGRPAGIAARDFEDLVAATLADMTARLDAAGIEYDVSGLETDPLVIAAEAAAYRDMLRRREIDNAVAQTYLGSATDEMLDYRAADYGVLRRVVQIADELTGTPEILEDDDSLRYRARLAWEALSVAGPVGGYVFHALDAHPNIFDAIAYGPESGFVAPGGVLVIVQSRSETGVPTVEETDVVAARLDAKYTVYGDGTTGTRTVRDEQAVRPLGAQVTVMAAQPLEFDVTATLYVSPHGDREALRLQAVANLENYLTSRKRIARRVPISGIEAALALTDADGIPVIDDVDAAGADVIPNHAQIPVPRTITVTTEVR